MSLSVGLDVALSGLSTTAEQTAVVSRNVANAGTQGASRKTANVITWSGGGTRVASITRATNVALLEKMLGATSAAAAQSVIVESLDRLNQTVDDPELDRSPAAVLQKLNDALQQYAAAPHDAIRAQSAVATAQNMADTLNDATAAVQQVRSQADAGIADAVARLDTLLARFEAINNEVVKGSRKGADVTDLLDQRDRLLAEISEDIGIRTVSRADNDMAIFTDSGVTLFDIKARSITFERTLLYSANQTGNAVHIDGVPITGNTGTMLVGSGRLIGLTTVRDDIAITYQNQLDEIARGLIEAFAESDQSAVPALDDAPGLFTYPGAPAMPATGTVVAGLAGAIRINASVDPSQGGDLSRLRDGGMAGAAYVYNGSGAAAFVDRLNEYVGNMAQPRSFDSAVQLVPSASIFGFSSASTSWLQEARKNASDGAEYANALQQRSQDSLAKETGVSIDEEMTSLLELERAYQASTRLVTTIDNMMKSLLAATG